MLGRKRGIITATLAAVIGIAGSAQAQSQDFCDYAAPGTRWDPIKRYCTDAPKETARAMEYKGSLTGTRSVPSGLTYRS